MQALKAGTAAPEVVLPLVEGGQFLLRDALGRGPVVLAFFKVSCPVCQFAFPYIERIHRAQRDSGVTIVGVSQDDAKTTRAFLREYGITFPTALDDTRRYPVSNAYGLTNVPTFFYVAPSGSIELTSVGWSRQDMEELNRLVAGVARKPPAPVFRPGENVPDFKPG